MNSRRERLFSVAVMVIPLRQHSWRCSGDRFGRPLSCTPLSSVTEFVAGQCRKSVDPGYDGCMLGRHVVLAGDVRDHIEQQRLGCPGPRKMRMP